MHELQLNPLTTKDYDVRAKQVVTAYASESQYDAADLISPTVFGSSSYGVSEDRSLQQYHMRGYIDLHADADLPGTPILNPVIAGVKGETLAKVLGVKSSTMRAILNFDVVSDEHELIPIGEVPDMCFYGSYKFGPQIVADMVADFDIDQALQEELEFIVWKYLSYVKAKFDVLPGRIKRGDDSGLPLIGDYYFVPTVPMQIFSKWMQFLEEAYYTSINSRAAYLYALSTSPDGRERLDSSIMYRIMVTPMSTRPRTSISKIDPLTKSYAEVMRRHTLLVYGLLGSGPISAPVVAYRRFIEACNQLLYSAGSAGKNNKAILDRIKGKKGHIRDKMLGKRIDYSGRSVITIDPFMSIRNIGIPQDMLPKLYRSAILRTLPMGDADVQSYLGSRPEKMKRCLERIKSQGLLDKIKVVTGRQPTLHKLSMRAFTPVAVPGRSIQLNPLCVIGFNADFDGDQMYVRVPTTKEGIREANELMPIEQNMFIPKNGECSVMPRQEIIYGLNVCTRAGMTPTGGKFQSSFKSFSDLVEAIRAQRVEISTQVTCQGISGCAGRVAYLLCWDKTAFTPQEYAELQIMEVTSSSIKPYVNKLVRHNANTAIDCIDNMVLLGFVVAGTYPPTLDLLGDNDVDYSKEMDAFHDAIAEDAMLYNMGWETEEEYDENYTTAFESCVDHAVKASVTTDAAGKAITRIEQDAGVENGFVRMSRSGARGSNSNLLQLYGYKGRVQDGSTGGSFRAVIEHSYASQLTPLEHFVTAYGGRAGLIQKSLSTADSGYTMRKMWHTTSPFMIVDDDCGSTEGITISLTSIKEALDCDLDTAKSVFIDMVVGRYLAKPKEGVNPWNTSSLVTEAIAKKWVEEEDCRVEIRTILTCKNPCCKKCYGIDLSTLKVAAIGLPIGLIAAQSIGEPGTQLNMDAFKKGGIASSASNTRLRGFSKLVAYSELSQDFDKLPSYDPIAWADGEVVERPKVNGTKAITITGSKKSVTLDANVPIKRGYIHKGEGLREYPGDQDVSEIAKYDSLLHAQRYLCYSLYDVYRDEGAVNLKHFEVLAYAMTMSMVVTTDQPDLVPGQWHDMLMMNTARTLDRTKYFTQLHSVSRVPIERPYALSRIAMERIRDGLSSSLLLGLSDPLVYPFNRILMGLEPLIGPGYDDGDDFIKQRRV